MPYRAWNSYSALIPTHRRSDEPSEACGDERDDGHVESERSLGNEDVHIGRAKRKVRACALAATPRGPRSDVAPCSARRDAKHTLHSPAVISYVPTFTIASYSAAQTRPSKAVEEAKAKKAAEEAALEAAAAAEAALKAAEQVAEKNAADEAAAKKEATAKKAAEEARLLRLELSAAMGFDHAAKEGQGAAAKTAAEEAAAELAASASSTHILHVHSASALSVPIAVEEVCVFCATAFLHQKRPLQRALGAAGGLRRCALLNKSQAHFPSLCFCVGSHRNDGAPT